MSDVTDAYDVLEWRSRDADGAPEAIRIQDDLREKSDDDWSGESEVKRWRAERSSS